MDPHLLQAVLADPDDDAIRLIYADFLEENGHTDRADLIRVQIKLAKLENSKTPMYAGHEPTTEIVFHPKSKVNPIWREEQRKVANLRRREGELLRMAQGYEWFGDHGDLVWWVRGAYDPNEHPSRFVCFRRGFVEEISCSAADWIAHADSITVSSPIREVILTTWPVLEESTIGRLIPGEGPWHPPRRLAGRTRWWTWEELSQLNFPGGPRERLLAAEWPGIRFTLPPIYDLIFSE